MPATFLSSQNTEDQTPDEVTPDNPQTAEDAARQQKQAAKEEQEEEEALKLIRLTFKQSWASKRRLLIQRVLRAFEYLKNNPYALTNYDTLEMDPISQVLAGNASADSPDLYQYNDNVYQMLCLSFMAALGPDIAKTRWMPDDPQQEGDLAFAKKASTMMAFIERLNEMPSLQMLKLLYLFTAGSYFCYTRNLVDAVRAGITRTPVYAMQQQMLFPDRYVCGQCGGMTPANGRSVFTKPTCADCGQGLGQQDFYPALTAMAPTQVDTSEAPNSMTAIDVFSLLNVDLDPDAPELTKTPILDLEGEMSAAAVRASYPERYKDIAKGQFADEATSTSFARIARERVTSPTSDRALTAEDQRGSFSRCWIQAWAFNCLEDQELAARLTKKYPKGVKLVTYGADVVLEKRPENLLEHWTDGRTVKGLGMYPFGIGDVALSVQDRLDDTANNIHIYQDRMALPPVLANAALVDANAMGKVRWGGGRVIPVYPSQKTPGMRYQLSEALWQPTFHADTQIYNYSQQLVMLMQLLTGIQPQIFGGGTQKGVDTATGQEQMLNTAMGRLMMFLSQMRTESARTAKLAVKAMASDIDGQKRVTVEGAVDGEYDNAFILESDVQGEIHAYPDADQGFPAGYGEMRDRLIQLLGMVEKNPVLQQMLSDPDMQKLLALYLLPDGAKLPGDSMRTKIKLVVQQLSKGKPNMLQAQPGGPPIVIPTIQPDPDVDDMGECVLIAKEWMQDNFTQSVSNPNGYGNVRAYLKLAATLQAKAAATQAAMQAAAGQPGGAGAGGGAPPPGGAPALPPPA